MNIRACLTIAVIILFLFAGHWFARPAFAVNCSSIGVSGDYTVNATCTFPNTPYDGVDGNGGSGINNAKIVIGASGSLSILNGQTLLTGSVQSNSGGSITIVDGGSFKTESPIYVTDADGDGYSPQSSMTITSGSYRRYSRLGVYAGGNQDCGDGNSNAKPGQGSAFSTPFTNTVTGLSYDYNCDGTETKSYQSAFYACYVNSCTNGSGYTSSYNNAEGFSGSTPACGASGTYYTIANAGCINPAQASCAGAYNTQSVAQPCL